MKKKDIRIFAPIGLVIYLLLLHPAAVFSQAQILKDSVSVGRFNAECDARARIYDQLTLLAAGKNSGAIMSIADTLIKHEPWWKEMETRPEATYSKDYIMGLYAFNQLKFRDSTYIRTDLPALYHHLAGAYVGNTRDRILTYFFTRNYRKAGKHRELIIQALDQVKDSLCRRSLQKLRQATLPGQDVYPFDLPDNKGNRVKAADFKGKVVVCHFWFTRCHACLQMENYLRPISRKYKRNDQVVFINVNADKSKEVWLNSVREGLYGDPNEVSLYTEGLRTQHPFLKQYNYQGCPQLMIIDREGKIVTATAIQPRSDETALAFEKQLNEVLRTAK